MTHEELAAIRARLNAVTLVADEDQEDILCHVCNSMVDVRGDEADFYDDPICDECLCEFARVARQDVEALLAEVERLESFTATVQRVSETKLELKQENARLRDAVLLCDRYFNAKAGINACDVGLCEQTAKFGIKKALGEG